METFLKQRISFSITQAADERTNKRTNGQECVKRVIRLETVPVTVLRGMARFQLAAYHSLTLRLLPALSTRRGPQLSVKKQSGALNFNNQQDAAAASSRSNGGHREQIT